MAKKNIQAPQTPEEKRIVEQLLSRLYEEREQGYAGGIKRGLAVEEGIGLNEALRDRPGWEGSVYRNPNAPSRPGQILSRPSRNKVEPEKTISPEAQARRDKALEGLRAAPISEPNERPRKKKKKDEEVKKSDYRARKKFKESRGLQATADSVKEERAKRNEERVWYDRQNTRPVSSDPEIMYQSDPAPDQEIPGEMAGQRRDAMGPGPARADAMVQQEDDLMRGFDELTTMQERDRERTAEAAEGVTQRQQGQRDAQTQALWGDMVTSGRGQRWNQYIQGPGYQASGANLLDVANHFLINGGFGRPTTRSFGNQFLDEEVKTGLLNLFGGSQ